MTIDERLRFFNPLEDIEKHRNNLPHWQQPGASYFVTFRLADALPEQKLRDWKLERDAWLALHPEPWSDAEEKEYHERFSLVMEQWLDAGHGSCLLREPKAASVVGAALNYFNDQRCVQHAWVVMPNHVHALFTLLADQSLEARLHSWKSFTSKQIGGAGQLWQRDYFDRLIRSRDHFQNCVRYIRRNPIKAQLYENEYSLYQSDWVKEVVI